MGHIAATSQTPLPARIRYDAYGKKTSNRERSVGFPVRLFYLHKVSIDV